MFHLFSLPMVPLYNIIELANPRDLLTLSFCSKKSRKNVKFLWKKSANVDLEVTIGDECTVGVNVSGIKCDMVQCLPIKEKISATNITQPSNPAIPMKFKSSGLISTHWNDENAEMFHTIDYISDLFKTKTFSFHFQNQENPLEIIEKAGTKNLKNFSITSEKTIDENMFSDILTRCNPSGNMFLNANPPVNFEFSGNFHPCNSFALLNGFWFSSENLKSLNAERIIILRNSKISSQGVNGFVKHWLSGGCPRLKFLQLAMRNVETDEILEGLSVDFYRGPKRTYNYASLSELIFPDDFDIRRSDGVKATLVTKLSRNVFYMVVWPDSSVQAKEA